MRVSALLFGLLLSASLHAAEAVDAPPVELKLLTEHPVDGMFGGNLSGLAHCAGELLAVSDRDDAMVYRLTPQAGTFEAVAERFDAQPPPPSGLPWGLRMRAWVAGMVRGGELDFEGLSCDSAGNRYLVSESHAAVLQITPSGSANWLNLPPSLVRQARASGMLLHFNALLEGIAVDPAGERLWLAAEQQRRGILVLHRKKGSWTCTGGCVLLSQGGVEPSLPLADNTRSSPRDFSDLAFFDNKLFTLERGAHRICRRSLNDGKKEKCWSFAASVLTEERRYPFDYGVVEAMALKVDGVWLGADNGNDTARGDGERRPILWHFAAPKGGWSAP
ncbi:esterase-like activity of phytase family protein [Pseudomonas sp. PDM14]|uniref:esterase-like activity of phytase family protein n=1 Tax=Pseudomonas sp. PDM14 TaxID=2769288 RepID=UPI00399A9458